MKIEKVTAKNRAGEIQGTHDVSMPEKLMELEESIKLLTGYPDEDCKQLVIEKFCLQLKVYARQHLALHPRPQSIRSAKAEAKDAAIILRLTQPPYNMSVEQATKAVKVGSVA